MKTCKYCGIENHDNAKFCRNCGKELLEVNILDVFPSYDFVPVSVYKWPINPLWKILYYFFILLAIISVLFEINMIEPYQYSPEHYFSFIVLWGIIFFISFYIIIYSYKKKTPPNYAKFADYIQRISGNSPRYQFFCKNGKMGVIDIKRCQVQIPAKYDVLKWKTSQSIIIAIKDNQTSYIDIHGNELK